MTLALYVEENMRLPPDKTCGDCLHFGRCKWLISCKAHYTSCDWAPSRFQEAERVEPNTGEPGV